MEGVSTVSARILEYNAGRAADLLTVKYSKMAARPFAFYRATCHLFAEAWPRRSPLNSTPPVWGCGDLHFENFGSYKGDNRLVYFDVNDFDESALLPAAWEITRLAASIFVGAKELGIGARSAAPLVRTYLEAYRDALRSERALWVERDSATGMTRDLLDDVRLRRRKGLLKGRTTHHRGKRRLTIDGERALVAPPREQKLVRALVARATAGEDQGKFYRVLDVARRISGLGSLGMPRWVALIEGKGSPDANYLLDIKEARVSAAEAASPYAQPRWKTQAERSVQLQRRIQAMPPALLHAVGTAAHSYALRELQPAKDRLHLEDWSGDLKRLGDAMETMGRVTAWAALRGSGRQGSATADELGAFGRDRSWMPAVVALARRMSAQTLSDWKQFRGDVRAGRVISPRG